MCGWCLIDAILYSIIVVYCTVHAVLAYVLLDDSVQDLLLLLHYTLQDM